ncbi:SpoIIE family protein phosphatase [Bacteroides sp. GM023]|uniref:SpoIIE family protein phosphatase n=1 Tax=Bacteroides sp. GM023 TaxID=2723058 RepID=UPI00168B24C8|nr:SpoIIE family protein phosphatase [Bacteroides sp. GM023]MBD3591800.1 SpoIIE family protein phosphatase [Bacteroides sp. GM023]
MKRTYSRSFATRLSVYVLSFILIVFAVIMGLFYKYSHEKVTNFAIERTHGLLSNITTEITSQLRSVETTINQSVWVLEKNINQPDSLHHVITSIIKNNPLIVGSGIAFVPDYYKEKGKYFMPYVSFRNNKIAYQVLGSQNYDYPCMDWYLIPKMLKQDHWSEPYYDDGGGNIIMSTYSKPLYNNRGELYAIFIASISLSQFTDNISLMKPYSASYTYLLSRNGSFLTHENRSKILNETVFTEAFSTENQTQERIGREMLAGKTGTVRFDNLGTDSYAFYTAIPEIGWSVCTVCPSKIILQELDSTSRNIIYTFSAGILVLFLIVYSIIHRLVRPLKRFSESAREIATGRFDVTLPQVHSKDEIRDLHDSLAYMQKSLSTYVNELKETTASKERIESELSIARDIQMGMLPKIFPPYPDRNDVDLHAILKPAKEVGGDLYDFYMDGNRLYFLIGDVSGKGVPASLFMAITRSLFRTLSHQVLSPAKIVTEMNNSISDNNESNMFVTLIVGILDLETGVMKLCNAGHNPPILIHPDKHVSFLEFPTQIFVGVIEDFTYTDAEITLEKGSKLFLYTDGITEAENTEKELYGDDKLLEVLSANTSSNVRTTVDVIVSSIADHVKEAEASDDLTILLIQYEPEEKTVK